MAGLVGEDSAQKFALSVELTDGSTRNRDGQRRGGTAMAMTAGDYDAVRELVRRTSGIVIGPGNEDIVEARLRSLADRRGIDSVAGLVSSLGAHENDPFPPDVVRAIASIAPAPVCDPSAQSLLVSVILPDLFARRRDRAQLRFWCADCGCGQNPYGIALLLREHFPYAAAWKIAVLATDRSSTIIGQLRDGSFSRAEADRVVPPELLHRHFHSQGLEWRIDPAPGCRIEFRTMGLNDDPAPEPGFDLVILGHSLPYYERLTRREILTRLHALLAPDGYLLLRDSGSSLEVEAAGVWESCHGPGCYRPRAGQSRRTGC